MNVISAPDQCFFFPTRKTNLMKKLFFFSIWYVTPFISNAQFAPTSPTAYANLSSGSLTGYKKSNANLLYTQQQMRIDCNVPSFATFGCGNNYNAGTGSR